MANHTITLCPTLLDRLLENGWCGGPVWALNMSTIYTKTHGDYCYLAEVDYATNRATFTRYERLSK